MATIKELRNTRSRAWGATLTRLRNEFPDEHARLVVQYRDMRNPTQCASTELRQIHPERAAEIYREEVLARGLPEPVQLGRRAVVSGGEPS